ncbi:tripartite tricarboxylate transporter substrate binding protein [Variovorax sp. E3]|uniref:Bug family tripartite tricarboxylate transporter substrate binding protein n=1 Tax=Variovorax sp. E3 TaxID=1914993 RepID=UPI0018DE0653|nr:tripartite tricarboxylate transporter substrate binding protein [Variovorax sp. E3]
MRISRVDTGWPHFRLIQLLLLWLVIGLGSATAQSYPEKSKPIRLVVPFNAGSSTDAIGRALARGMAEVAGLNVVVENMPGAEAVLGTRAVKQAAPDGYTMLLTTLSTHAVNPHMLPKLPYDPIKDFVPLVGVAQGPLVMSVGPAFPFKSAREFFAAARANPGKYTFGSASATTRLAGEMLGQAAGIRLLAVPYKSFSDLMTNLVAGEIHFTIADVGGMKPFYGSGVRPLASVSGKRIPAFPDVPTMQEEGLPSYEASVWFATYFPANTPPAIAERMRDLLNDAAKTKYVTEVLSTSSLEPMPLAGQELDAFQRAELEKWGKAVRAANLGPKQ